MAALASASVLLTSIGCFNGPTALTREQVCAELETRGACDEGSEGCVLVNCSTDWNCRTGNPSEDDLPLLWVSTEALAEVGVWCQDQGGHWYEIWCDDTRGETLYDVYVQCHIEEKH